MTFFLFAESETFGAMQRFWTGMGLGVAIMIAYTLWRDPKTSIAGIPGHLLASLPVWGKNLSLVTRKFPRACANEETRKVLVDAARTTVMLLFIIINALLFAHVLTSERIPQVITGVMLDAGFNWFTFLIAVNILLLIGGVPHRHGAGG